VIDELEAIRARHKEVETEIYYDNMDTPTWRQGADAHTDRATLLRLLDAAREELDKEQVSHLKTRVRLTRIREAASDPVLIDGDERTTVRIFTPYDPATRTQGESS
jgi:hypothetical protein